MTHETFRELLPLYVIGALDGEELREFERYVAENRARCEAELAQYQAVADQIALAALPAEPSRDVFRRVMAAIEAEHPVRMRETAVREREGFDLRALIFRWIPWAATAALCVLVIVMTDQLRMVNDEMRMASEKFSELRAQYTGQQDKISSLNAHIEDQTRQIEAQSREFRNQTDQLRAKNDEQRLDIEALQAANTRLAAEQTDLQRVADELRQQLEQQTL